MIQKIGSNFSNIRVAKVQHNKNFAQTVPMKQLGMDTISFGNIEKTSDVEENKPRIIAMPQERFRVPDDYRLSNGVVRDNDALGGRPLWTPNSVEHVIAATPKFNPQKHKGLYPLQLKTGSNTYRVGMYDPAHTEVYTYENRGYLYVNNFGHVTKFDNNVDEFSPDVFLGTPAKQVIEDFRHHDTLVDTKVISALIRDGRMSEIMECVADGEHDYIIDSLKALGFNEKGEYDRDLKINIATTPSFHYDRKIEEIDRQMQSEINDAPSRAEYWQPSGSDRAFNFFVTLGVSEIVRAVKKNSDKNRYITEAQNKAQKAKTQLNEAYAKHQTQTTDKLKRAEQAVADFQILKAKKAQTQKEVRSIFSNFSIKSAHMPYSIGFVGENNVLAKEFAKNVAEELGVELYVAKYSVSHEDVISDIKNQISRLARYGTGEKRTILYIENIDALLDCRLSSEEQMQKMREFLDVARTSFTIMYDTKDFEKLHEELSLSSKSHHRVDIPATFEEANFAKRLR
ncbi:MAG: hypothetical protein IJ003_01580 [Candidatus Gastranaerophilales bacterium]|nr:hypothetical protein [Candidatus Gastranaerophilales bacterium]